MNDCLVFADERSELSSLIEQCVANPRHLRPCDVTVRDAARAQEGEAWSPRLLPYEAWGSATPARATSEPLPADRIGLIYTGARGMGIDPEQLDAVLAEAVRGSALADPASSAVVARRVFSDGVDGIVVRKERSGYALVGFDVRRFAHEIGGGRVTVVLPASVGGVPIVRIAAEAFARRYVQGVAVRLLVVPDTVERIDEGAFSALAAQRIHLGASVSHCGNQPCDLAATSPRLAGRSYTVDERNERYRAYEGSLYDAPRAALLAAASPYGACERVLDGVREIGAAAWCSGCTPPRMVYAPATLERTASRAFDDAVWVCPADTPAAASMRARDVRIASERVLERGGCIYDFDDDGAVLVAGPAAPRSASKRFAEDAAARYAPADSRRNAGRGAVTADALALPSHIDGAPLTRIGPRALIHAPETFVVPDTVRRIERDNACRGVRRVVLPEGLAFIGAHCFSSRAFAEPVVIPRSTAFVGKGSFEYAVCFLARTGSTVHVSADQLLSCFCAASGPDAAPFDYEAYDALLLSGRNLPDALGALVHRLSDPHAPTASVRFELLARLRAYGREARVRVARDGSRDEVAALCEAGFIDDDSFDEQIELLRSCNRIDCVLYLMEERARRGGASVAPRSSRARFAL